MLVLFESKSNSLLNLTLYCI